MRENVLDRIDAPDLALYFVWEPILGDDDEDAAHRATVLAVDPRAEHFWIPTQAAGHAFEDALPLVDEVAWDVYLVYDRGIEWAGATPPAPAYYQHQLVGRLPSDRLLDGAILRTKTLEILQSR